MQGDLIPWTIGQQFQDPDFPSLSGARIVRIAVHPGLNRAGYGLLSFCSHIMQDLIAFGCVAYVMLRGLP